MASFVVTADLDGKRADVALSVLDQNTNRAILQRLIKSGSVTLNGKELVSTSKTVHEGDVLTVTDSVNQVIAVEVPIVYEDDDVVVYNKPSGMLSHSKGPLNEEFTIADAVEKWWPGDTNRDGIVHRLDRVTSGVMICAKTPEAQLFLQKQFSSRKVEKVYLAVVEGQPKSDQYRIEWPIERNPKAPSTFRVGPNGKTAVTNITVVNVGKEFSVVECRPQTGRTHQIRVHLAKLGNPIIGDVLYGSNTNLGGRILLHAVSLTLRLPSGDKKQFVAEPPSDMQQYL